MRRICLVLIVTIFVFAPLLVKAESINKVSLNSYISNYRSYSDIKFIDLSNSSFIDLSLKNIPPHNVETIALYNSTKGIFEPFKIITQKINYNRPEIYRDSSKFNLAQLTDVSNKTYADFSIQNPGVNTTKLTVVYPEAVEISSLRLTLDPTSTKPYYVTLKYVPYDSSYPERKFSLLATKRQISGDGVISFLKVLSSEIEIDLEYVEPLRISEILFEPAPVKSTSYLRFLAQPGNSYRLFIDPQKYQSLPTGEAPNFNMVSEGSTIEGSLSNILPNNSVLELDSDKDGIMDTLDNCPNIINADQKDTNINSIGDACEDLDKDGVVSAKDNCPNNPNRLQQDSDRDGVGDACDPDESRLLEKYYFVPWLGLILGFGVVAVLLFTTVKRRPK